MKRLFSTFCTNKGTLANKVNPIMPKKGSYKADLV